MDPKPTVRLHKYRDRPYGLRWRIGDRQGEVTSGTGDYREAMRQAWKLEDDLAKGYRPNASASPTQSWPDFRVLYQEDYLPDTSMSNRALWRTTADHFERMIRPKYVVEIDAATISRFRVELLKTGVARATVDTYVRTLVAGINWGAVMGFRDRLDLPRRRGNPAPVTNMRDRVMTLEEFERMVDVALQRPRDGQAFARFMWGLWHSGLRISELHRLSWDAGAPAHVQLGDPNLIVFLGGQKNKQDGYQPAPPDFWRLVELAGHARSGPVFWIAGRWGGQMLCETIGKRIKDFGREAGVVVNTQTGRTASAHDIRASFLTHLADTATESDFATVARHSDPSTTKKHYLRREAAALANKLGW